jgi:anti-sigma B factor antagonist
VVETEGVMSAQDETSDSIPQSFEVLSEPREGVRVVVVLGELDLSTTPMLAASLEEAISSSDSAIAIDLSDCGFIDSTGIALLVSTWKQLSGESRGAGPGPLALCGVNSQVRRVFDITGLDPWMDVYPSLAEALVALRD